MRPEQRRAGRAIRKRRRALRAHIQQNAEAFEAFSKALTALVPSIVLMVSSLAALAKALQSSGLLRTPGQPEALEAPKGLTLTVIEPDEHYWRSGRPGYDDSVAGGL